MMSVTSVNFDVSVDGVRIAQVSLTVIQSRTWFKKNFITGTVFKTVGSDFTPVKCEISNKNLDTSKLSIDKIPMVLGAVFLNNNLNNGSFSICRKDTNAPGQVFGSFDGDNFKQIEEIIEYGVKSFTLTVV